MVRIAIFLAVAAAVVAVGVFFVPMLFSEELSWRAAVGGTLTTAIALMLGAIALLITARVESSDYKAEQQTKSDIAQLLATFASIQHKGVLLRTGAVTQIDFAPELAQIQTFVTSTTGFALHNLVARKSLASGDKAQEWRVFFLHLAEMLASPDNPGLILNRVIRVQEMMLKLKREDVRYTGASVSDLEAGIAGFGRAIENNVLLKVVRSVVGEEQGGLNAEERQRVTMAKLRYLKAQGIDDPDIDIFLAVDDNDQDALKAALGRGANPNVTDSAVLAKYEAQLAGFAG